MTSPNVFLRLGLSLIKTNENLCQTIIMRRFRSAFGVSPQVCSICWNLLRNSRPKNSKPIHLLWALFFLKCYNTEEVNHALTNVDEKTFRKWSWKFIELISNLEVISWERRFDNFVEGQIAYVSLDGTDFRICEPKPFSSKWFSHKFKGSGLRYEIGLNIQTGWIVWAHGGYPCGEWSDLKLARELFVKNLNPGEKAVADLGYRDTDFFILPNESNKEVHSKIMSRHETVNGRLKNFKVLAETFRHNIQKQPLCFYAIVNLVQISIENGEGLYNVI